MITVSINCCTVEEKDSVKSELYYAVHDSSAFANKEITIDDDPDNDRSLLLSIGIDNSHSIRKEIYIGDII